MDEAFVVAGIGELLWDVFPDGKRLGGAPVNFSYHCHQLGATGVPVSAVGADELGAEILNVVSEKQLPGEYVQEAVFPTGTVQVTLDENGKPSYEICEGVAWDHIVWTPELKVLAEKADAVCFGSLAQRNEGSRFTIRAFLEAMRADALKIFDVNLRQAYFSAEIIEDALKSANILKLSDEELPVLAEMFDLSGTVQDQLKELVRRYELKLIVYTRGPDGSLLIGPDEMDDHPGCPGAAVNSVGAGDSFTATLCTGLLKGKPLAVVNEMANRVATFVCSQDGATPVLPDSLKELMV